MQKIVACGSMVFSDKMLSLKEQLSGKGIELILPEGVEEYADGGWDKKVKDGWDPSVEGANRKIENDLIRKHYEEINKSDAVLIVNEDKRGIKGYVGGNTFLEMGFAHILRKSIYVLNELPEQQDHIYQELVAMQPIILSGDLSKIKTL